MRKPEVQVRVDLERAANLGFQGKDIADAVEAAGGGQRTVSQYDVGGRYFYIQVMGQESNVKTVSDVERMILTSPTNPNVQVPLTSVASVETTFGPLQINHYNSRRAARVQFTIQGRPLSEVFSDVVSGIESEVPLPVGYRVVPFGAINYLKTLVQAIGFRVTVVRDDSLPPLGHAVPIVHSTLVYYSQCAALNYRREYSCEHHQSPFRLVHHTRVHNDGGSCCKKCDYIDYVHGSAYGKRDCAGRGARTCKQTKDAPYFHDSYCDGLGNASAGSQTWRRGRDLQRLGHVGGGRSVGSDSLHPGIHPCCLHYSRGRERPTLED